MCACFNARNRNAVATARTRNPHGRPTLVNYRAGSVHPDDRTKPGRVMVAVAPYVVTEVDRDDLPTDGGDASLTWLPGIAATVKARKPVCCVAGLIRGTSLRRRNHRLFDHASGAGWRLGLVRAVCGMARGNFPKPKALPCVPGLRDRNVQFFT